MFSLAWYSKYNWTGIVAKIGISDLYKYIKIPYIGDECVPNTQMFVLNESSAKDRFNSRCDKYLQSSERLLKSCVEEIMSLEKNFKGLSPVYFANTDEWCISVDVNVKHIYNNKTLNILKKKYNASYIRFLKVSSLNYIIFIIKYIFLL